MLVKNVYVSQHRLRDAVVQIDAFIKEHSKAPEPRALDDFRQKIVKNPETP